MSMNNPQEQELRNQLAKIREALEVESKEDLIDQLETLITQREQAVVLKIKEKNLEFVEGCEPDCDPVRHAHHQGSWDHFMSMEHYIKKLATDGGKE